MLFVHSNTWVFRLSTTSIQLMSPAILAFATPRYQHNQVWGSDVNGSDVCVCDSDHVECPVSGCTCRCMSLDAVRQGDAASAAGEPVESWYILSLWYLNVTVAMVTVAMLSSQHLPAFTSPWQQPARYCFWHFRNKLEINAGLCHSVLALKIVGSQMLKRTGGATWGMLALNWLAHWAGHCHGNAS